MSTPEALASGTCHAPKTTGASARRPTGDPLSRERVLRAAVELADRDGRRCTRHAQPCPQLGRGPDVAVQPRARQGGPARWHAGPGDRRDRAGRSDWRRLAAEPARDRPRGRAWHPLRHPWAKGVIVTAHQRPARVLRYMDAIWASCATPGSRSRWCTTPSTSWAAGCWASARTCSTTRPASARPGSRGSGLASWR